MWTHGLSGGVAVLRSPGWRDGLPLTPCPVDLTRSRHLGLDGAPRGMEACAGSRRNGKQ